MQKIAIGLTALLLLAAVSKPAAAQEAIVYPQIPCIWYEAVEFPGCVNYGTLSEEEARPCKRRRRPRPSRHRMLRGSSRLRANRRRVLSCWAARVVMTAVGHR
jgi:hypothetical protein